MSSITHRPRLCLLLLAGLAALAIAFHAKAETARGEPVPPKVFADLDEAVAHAKDTGKRIFMACILRGDADSKKLDELLSLNSIYLSGETVAVYAYRVLDERRVDNFRRHFKVVGNGTPIVVVADSWGKPLASKTGLLEAKEYTAFVKETAGDDAVKIPPEGMFDLEAGGGLVGSEDLTEVRVWTQINGRKLKASLVEAKGNKGVFRTPEDKTYEIPFNYFIPADVEFLKEHVPSMETPSAFEGI